jgi:hypothetical protein
MPRRGNHSGTQFWRESKNVVKWTKLSCRRLEHNEARLQLFAWAYDLANCLRQLALPWSIRRWNPTTLREHLVKIGARVMTRAKYVNFQLAEVAVHRLLLAADMCLGVRFARLTMQFKRRPRASAVRRSGRFRGMSQGEASCAVGSGRDGAGSGAFWGDTVATVPPRG